MNQVDVDAVIESLARAVPRMLALFLLVGIGLVLTDGAEWVTIVGFFGGAPLLTYLSSRDLNRHKATEL